ARIRRSARDDQLGFVLMRQALDRVVVDELRLKVKAIRDNLEPFAGKVDRRAVRQMAAVRKTHPENRVARLHRSEEHGLVRLRSGMGLDVRGVGAKQLLYAIDRQALGDVDEFATAVVTLAWIAFRIFVGELRSLCLQHRHAGVILRRDQLDMLYLAPVFRGDRLPELRIRLRKSER